MQDVEYREETTQKRCSIAEEAM